MVKKFVTRCENCGNVVSRKKFLNKNFYVTIDSQLVVLVGDNQARAVGCQNCLQLLEALENGQLEKFEFNQRTIYKLHPTLLDRIKEKLETFFNGKPRP